MDALKALREDKSIIIYKADKGNAIALLYKIAYINKITAFYRTRNGLKGQS